MVKYHINSNGQPMACKAVVKPCPLGEHFTDLNKAQDFADNKNLSRAITEWIHKDSSVDPSNPQFDALRTDRAEAELKMKGSQTLSETIENVLINTGEADGGSSFNPITRTTPVVGFCYSPYPERSKVYNSIQDLKLSDYNDYFESNKDLLSKDNHYIGTWNDPETGKIYLDISINTMNANEAREECLNKDQIAFFDLQDFSSVTVDNNATSGQGL